MRYVLYFFALTIGLFLISNNALAIDYGGLSVLPYQKNTKDSRFWFIYKDKKPGEEIKDQLIVVNNSPKDVDLILYPVDAQTTSDGAFAPNSDDAPRLELGQWTTLNLSELKLKTGQSKIIDFKIKIPEKVTPGDHVGTIIVRQKEAQGLDGDQTGLSIVIRVGARIYLTVAGELIKDLSFDDIKFNLDESGKPFFYFSLSNNGNTRLTPKGFVEIFDGSGKSVDKFDVDLREIFPFTKTVVPIGWVGARAGSFKAKATINSEAGKVLIKEINFDYMKGDLPITTAGVLDLFKEYSLLIGGFIIALLLIIIFLLTKR